MAIYAGDCRTCQRRNVDLFTHNDKCITCTRLDNLEKNLKDLTNALSELAKTFMKK